MDGFFSAIEGIDGAGKDTLGGYLRDFFQGTPREVLLTGEPSGGQTGRLIRQILDHEVSAPKTNFEFQRLFVEDRREHLEAVIRPALAAGKPTITVRYWLSTLAYGMLEKPVEEYLNLHREVIGEEMVTPDLTLLLDLDPELGLDRILRDGRHFDHFAKSELLMKIRANYLELARRQEELKLGKIVVIDAAAPREAVFDEALHVILRQVWEKLER